MEGVDEEEQMIRWNAYNALYENFTDIERESLRMVGLPTPEAYTHAMIIAAAFEHYPTMPTSVKRSITQRERHHWNVDMGVGRPKPLTQKEETFKESLIADNNISIVLAESKVVGENWRNDLSPDGQKALVTFIQNNPDMEEEVQLTLDRWFLWREEIGRKGWDFVDQSSLDDYLTRFIKFERWRRKHRS